MKKCRFPSLLAAVILLAALFLPMSAAAVEDPGLTCRNAILIDATYDEVLYDKGAYDKVYPSSITKVMTALLVLEAVDAGELTLDTPITATAEALEVPKDSSTAKIQVGDTYTLEQYLYCLLLPSGNEVAQILAIAVDGSVEAFVDHMNQRAEELGCEGTHFANPHGYHDENHYTTAYDITRFMKAAMEYDLFQTILTSPNYTLPANGVSEERIIRNTNALTSNWTYTQYLYGPGTGGKTGTTDEAGCCLVETARKGDMYLISVILGAEEVKQADGSTDARQFSETIKLLNWGFDNFQRVTLSPDEALVEIGTSPVLTDDGLLVMLTNGATREVHADGTVDVDYRCGQIVIDPAEPTKVMARLQEPWLRPQTYEDTHGLVSNVTFVEGLVKFRGRWFAYYGQSDTTLAVAVADPADGFGVGLRADG